MKTILSICLAVLALTGCINIVQPPESSYNGLYLQMYKAKGPFIMQVELKEQQECALLAANIGHLSTEQADAFCTKTPNKAATVKSWSTLNENKTAYSLSFDSMESCAKYLEEGIKSGAITVHRFCYKAN